MTFTKTLTATALLALTGTVNADFLGIYAGAERWNYDTDGFISSGPDNIDLNQDLGLQDNDDNVYYLAFEHPVPILPNIKVQQNNLKGTGTGTASQDIQFQDGFIAQGNTINSGYDLSHTDYTLYYELLDNWVNLDLGLTGKDFDGYFEVERQEVGLPYDSVAEFDGIIPAIYGKAQFDLPFTGLRTGAIVNIGEKSGDKISDVKAYLAYETESGLGLELGYRTFDIKFDDLDSISSDITIDGFYAGITLHL